MNDASQIPESIADTPPSTKLVWMTLQRVNEPVSVKDVTEWTSVAPSTAYHALVTLEEEGLVEARPDLESPHRTLYYR